MTLGRNSNHLVSQLWSGSGSNEGGNDTAAVIGRARILSVQKQKLFANMTNDEANHVVSQHSSLETLRFPNLMSILPTPS